MWNIMECERDSCNFLGQNFDQLIIKFDKEKKDHGLTDLIDLRRVYRYMISKKWDSESEHLNIS